MVHALVHESDETDRCDRSRSAVSNAIKAVGQGQWSDEAVELVLGAVRKGDKKAIKTLQTAMKKNPPEGEVGPLTDVLKTKFDTEGSTFLKDFTGSKSKSKLKSTISSIFSFG